MSDNPVLAEHGLPYGLPDFSAIGDDDFLPAYELALPAHLAEVEAIAANPEPPSFANTVAALEAAGRLLARANGIFFNLEGPDTNPQRAAIAQELAVRLTEHSNAITMHPQLFARIAELFQRRDELGLSEPELRLLEQRYRDAVRAGAGLDADGQQQMREISGRLATLTTDFSQKLLADTNASAVLLTEERELDGLSAAEIAAAQRGARDAGHEQGWLIPLELPTSQAAVAKLTDPAVRQRIFEASINRCARGNEHDTRALLLESVALRARRAALLGYPDHAAYVIAEETAPDPAAVADLLRELGAAAMAAGERELTRLTAALGHEPGPADVTYALALAAGGGLDTPAGTAAERFEEYCELNTVLRDGVFYAAGELYGLTFTERDDLQGYHPDVRVWEVFRDGTGIGLFLGDFYARPSKRGGAWMNNVVDQSSQLGTAPIVVNVLNLTKPSSPDQPCLLTLDQLTTLFHEFGHAIHGLLSEVDYVSQSGTSVPRDFVEFPSQVNEMWALHPDVAPRYAKHHRTGEPAPAELLDAVRAVGDTESAHSTIEYLAAAALDLAWHRLTEAEVPDTTDPDAVAAFEQQALTAAGLAHPLIPPRYRSSYFNHIFGGGYSSAYYSYIWSEILDAETEQWFLAAGGLRPEQGRAFAEAVLQRGDSVDPVAAHAAMLGHPARIEPLLRRRGLVPTGG